MKTNKRYELRCVFCGAEIYTDDLDRICYKCESRMKLIRDFTK